MNALDGFTNVTTNRTTFPLSQGFISLNSEHPQWSGKSTLLRYAVTLNQYLLSAAFYIVNNTNPNSFSDFLQVNSFFQLQGEGSFCIPLDLATSNFTGLHNGQNVTIQVGCRVLTTKSNAYNSLNRCCMTEGMATCSKYVF